MKSVRWVVLALVTIIGTAFVGACGDDDSDSDVAAMCEQMATIEGPDDISVEKLDQLLEVAPDAIEDDVRLIRDRLDADGEAAYEDEAVGAAFERVGAFEEEEC